MDDYVIINEQRIPCRARFITINTDNLDSNRGVSFLVSMTFEQATEVFTDDADISIDYGTDIQPLADYRMLHSITDYRNGTVEVTYQKLSDLEKLIELHYGGVNNEGSI